MQLGLSLSGGGIRAAVFHFGLLHRLARSKNIEDIKFLSTVSGGSLAIALVYTLNGGVWPDSNKFITDIAPKLRQLLTNVHLQRSLLFRSAYKPWKVPFARANIMAETIRAKWNVNLSLKDLPDTPRWFINTTCYETGKKSINIWNNSH